MPVEKIKEIFKTTDLSPEVVRSRIDALDHFEIARRLHEFPLEEKIRIFHLLVDEKQQELLYETDHDSRLEIQDSLAPENIAHLIEEMPEDEATDILKEHSEETREEILEKMAPAEASVIKDLINYGEETAGGLMEPNFNKVKPSQTAADILVQLKRDRNPEAAPYFYVVGDRNELLGFFKLRDLLNVSAIAHPSEFMREETPRVMLDDPCEKVANLMDHEHLSMIPVVNEKNQIQGVVTFDDVIKAMRDIANDDFYAMAGSDRGNPFAKKTVRKIWARAPWLFTTFIGGLISAFIIASYKDSLVEFATVVLFIPFVIGLAGNVAIQGATVIVRGLATGDIQSDNIAWVVKSELLVGLSNGLIFGILCGFLITAMAHTILPIKPILGLTVGTGIVMAVGLSTFLGSFAPIGFIKAGIDPAISTGPFVIVLNDILGLAVYLASTAFIFSRVY